jgi:transcriptional regulator with PAS, ATPase and Fis domain
MVSKLNPHVNDPFASMVGTSPLFQQTISKVRKLSGTHSTVLLTGETGVGKERFAQAIHALREQEQAPFIAINCGALMASLVESELFGYEKGAFSGADSRGKPGKIELARGGTLFLDEIGELPSEMQVKLLRVLEERSYYPVGGTQTATADCRFIAATNRDLETLMRQGSFREDLYYRLSVIALEVPPLRSRKEDLLPLAEAFLREFSRRYERPITPLSDSIVAALLAYNWPGNVRELRNTMERLVVFSEEGIVRTEDLPPVILNASPMPATAIHALPAEGLLSDWLTLCERQYIDRALEQSGGNKQAAARRLGISRMSLYKKLGASPTPPSEQQPNP